MKLRLGLCRVKRRNNVSSWYELHTMNQDPDFCEHDVLQESCYQCLSNDQHEIIHYMTKRIELYLWLLSEITTTAESALADRTTNDHRARFHALEKILRLSDVDDTE